MPFTESEKWWFCFWNEDIVGLQNWCQDKYSELEILIFH